MERITSRIDPSSSEFQENTRYHRALADGLRDRLTRVRKGGSEAAVEKHRSRGKLMVRERIEKLLDPKTLFLELSPLAAWGRYEKEIASAGLVPTHWDLSSISSTRIVAWGTTTSCRKTCR